MATHGTSPLFKIKTKKQHKTEHSGKVMLFIAHWHINTETYRIVQLIQLTESTN